MSLQDQLLEILGDLGAIKTETSLILGAIILIVAGLVKKSKPVTVTVYGLTLVGASYFLWTSNQVGEVLSKSLVITPLSQNFSAVFIVAAVMILLFRRSKEHVSEFYFFILSLLVGSILMMRANSLLIVYMAVELSSFSSYILTNFSFKKQGYEAGIKYLLFGAVSTAIMLFGLGLIYGSTGTFFITDWKPELFDQVVPGIGLAFLVFGVLFKASITPFHIWVPATYQTAPSDATAFMSIVPKLAALMLLQRINVTIVAGELVWYTTLILTLGVLTIGVGTLSALRQKNTRRMISFGAVAHSGFLLPLAFMNSPTANETFWWYSVAYMVMNMAVFYLLDVHERKGVFENTSYSSHGGASVGLGVAFSVILVSLVGLPPLAGFTAKFFLFTSLWESYWNGQAIFGVYLLVSVFATVISLFFYLRIPYYLFLIKSEAVKSIKFSRSSKIIATLFSIVLLLLFFAPQILTVMQQVLNSRLAHE